MKQEGPPSVHLFPTLEHLSAPDPHSQNNGPFGDFTRGPPTHGDGNFEGFLIDSPGTRKKGGGDSSMNSEPWGLPEEVGQFGRFLDDFDEDFLLGNSRDRQGWPAAESPHFGSPPLDGMQVRYWGFSVSNGEGLYARARFRNRLHRPQPHTNIQWKTYFEDVIKNRLMILTSLHLHTL